jgi:hypothetical protein
MKIADMIPAQGAFGRWRITHRLLPCLAWTGRGWTSEDFITGEAEHSIANFDSLGQVGDYIAALSVFAANNPSQFASPGGSDL